MSNFQNYLDNALNKLDVKDTNDNVFIPKLDYDIANEISELLVSIRKEMGISQRHLAEKTGIPQANISKIENSHYLPSLLVLKRLADGLGRRLVIDFVDLESDAED